MDRLYRRHLPHWRIDEGVCAYFATWRAAPLRCPLPFDERSTVSATLLHYHLARYELHAFVVMDDHVHVVVSMPANEALERAVQNWKSYSAHVLARRRRLPGPVWQDESFDRVIRDDAEFRQKVDYIAGNPWKRWPHLTDYEWVWVGGAPGRLGIARAAQ